MINFSFAEKLVQLKDILLSYPFFLVSLIIGIVLLIIMFIGIKKNRRIHKIIIVVAWIFVIIFCVVRYHTFLISIFDRLFGRIVEEIYFPSLSVYTFCLLFANVVFVYSLFRKKMYLLLKFVNLALAMEFDFLFILILDTIMKNNIDIYAELEVYTNSNVLVLLEFSMILFMVWILVMAILFLIQKYAVKKVFVTPYKEEDYEVLNIADSTVSRGETVKQDEEEILDLEETNNDNIEIVDL